MFESLIKLGVGGIKTLISNARVGKQVLATGATITTQTSGSGTNASVNSAGSSQVPTWLVPVVAIVGGLLVLVTIIKLIFKK